MNRVITAILIVILPFLSVSQEKPDYFLPGDVTYNPAVPTPEQFFGQQVGEWHLTHDQVLFYMKEIAKVSDRAILQEYARSWENRALVHLIFTSVENQKKLDEIKATHIKHAFSENNLQAENVPLVINLGYGVHGNESSATNSSVLTAYYLAAAEGEKINKLLDQCIILVDPCLNPDGFTRHSTWANMHQSYVANGDNNSRQFDEVWPGGRTNHYWFDLNRDYLLLVHPESAGRVSKFYEWLPNIVTDHHEMGANSSFFFQPGVVSRNNPLTPEQNYVLTNKIAAYHAKFLDNISATYFTEEQFDDYYLGKGSSYPDINSGIGILFEQAGFRGRIRETSNGTRKLAYGIRNQFTVTLSTLEAAVNLKTELLQHQKNFYQEAFSLSEKDPVKAYVFGSETDRLKTLEMVKFFQKHQIEVYENTKKVSSGKNDFNPGTSFVIPAKQKQYRLVKAFFESVATFSDSTFYDVSTWTIPYTFHIPFAKIENAKDITSGKPASITPSEGKIFGEKTTVGYLMKWDEYLAPAALYQLQKAGLLVKVANENMSFQINGSLISFKSGTCLVAVGEQKYNSDHVKKAVTNVASKTGIDFYALETGLSPTGIDIGSNNFSPLKTPEILLVTGGSSGDAGEIWHLFDQRYKMPVTLTETSTLNSDNLARYNTLILPGGSYSEINENGVRNIKSWIQNGGTLILVKSAAAWASRNEIGKTKFKKENGPDSTLKFSYADKSKETNLNIISGAIFNTSIDATHPLCYGYSGSELPVFKTGSTVAEDLGIKYAEPVRFTADPFLSGFVSNKNLEKLKNAPVVSVQKYGQGKIITYHESMTFRGIWLGTNKLLANGVFFAPVID